MEFDNGKLQKQRHGFLPSNGNLEQLWRTFVWRVNKRTSELLIYTLTALENKQTNKKQKLMPCLQKAYLSASSVDPVP